MTKIHTVIRVTATRAVFNDRGTSWLPLKHIKAATPRELKEAEADLQKQKSEAKTRQAERELYFKKQEAAKSAKRKEFIDKLVDTVRDFGGEKESMLDAAIDAIITDIARAGRNEEI